MEDGRLQPIPMLQNHTRQFTIYRCLAHQRRRHVLSYLKDTNRSQALADLAEYIAGQEAGSSASEIDRETVKDVYTMLYHVHVPKLEDAGFVYYEEDDNMVTLVEYPEKPFNTMTKRARPEHHPRTDPPSTSEGVAKLRLELNHLPLVKLEEKGLVEWDRDNHIVMKGPAFDEN